MQYTGIRNSRLLIQISAGIFTGVLVGITGVLGTGTLAGAACILLGITFYILIRIKYDLCVYLDIFLLSIVIFEPAPSDILLIVLMVFGILNRAVDLRKIKQHPLIPVIFLVYLLVSIYGIANAVSFSLAAKYYFVTFYLFLFSVYIFIYAAEHNFVSLIRAYITSTLFAAMLGFLGYIGLYSNILMSYSDSRVKALFKDPNVFGPFVVPSIIILMDDLKTKKIIKAGVFTHICLITVLAGAVVLSFSRAAWINLFAAALTYFILNFKRMKLFRVVFFAAAITVFIASIWVSTGNNQLKSFLNERARLQNYDDNRFSSQRAGLELASRNIPGYGPGQFELVVAEVTNEPISAHSLYIRLLTENGAAGFILFSSALMIIIMKLLIAHKSENGNRLLKSSVLLSIIIGIVINSLVVDTLHWRHFWFFIGISLFSLTGHGNSMSEEIFCGNKV